MMSDNLYEAGWDDCAKEKDAEIARLREQLNLGETGAKALADAKEESARLREELRLCIHVDKHIHITSGLNIEIERLRGDLAAMSDSVAVAAKALNDEEQENERLRVEKVAILAAKHVEIVPPSIPESYVIDTLNREIATLRSEIDRLRLAHDHQYNMAELMLISAERGLKDSVKYRARLQLLHAWIAERPDLLVNLSSEHPDLPNWFDEDGVPT